VDTGSREEKRVKSKKDEVFYRFGEAVKDSRFSWEKVSPVLWYAAARKYDAPAYALLAVVIG
jgi:hypothetical protein